MSPKKSPGKKAAKKSGAAAKKAAAKSKHHAASVKAVAKRKHQAAGKKAAKIRMLKVGAKKAAVARKAKKQQAAAPAPVEISAPPESPTIPATETPVTVAKIEEVSALSSTASLRASMEALRQARWAKR